MQRDYFDDTLLYCLGERQCSPRGPGSFDEPATAMFDITPPAGKVPVLGGEPKAVTYRAEMI
jgi:hypothetical protein